MTMSANRSPNRLIHEKSPYLLQHAYNPVDWYPWGEEAFEKAKEEDKPIFLSIGYSTCHWCHVMAHESFEDERMAELLNERFISIKVDREERPDVDSVYMKICQQMTGHGGWPLNLFLTPDQVPFYAGTYFPPKGSYGLPSFEEVVTQLYRTFKEDPEQIADVTASVNQAIEKSQLKKSNQRLGQPDVHKGYQLFTRLYDEEYGGFGGAPKFPSPHNLLFLLHYYHLTNENQALQMAEDTLDAMASGGLWDHIGYGFTRYSTDEKWLVPHFEKMLYDQALLLMAYTEAYQLTKKPFYREISEQIITFVNREMTGEYGAFYSGIDADSEGVEGKYYVWTYDEVHELLGEELGELYADAYQLTPTGNFEGANIPNRIGSDFEKVASRHRISVERLESRLEQARQFLLEEREKRVYPHVDDKVLTSWNAMMIAGLAKAAQAFGQADYTKMAKQAFEFIESRMFVDGRLMARYRDGEVKYQAYLDDYAYLILSALELYEVNFDLSYLNKATSWMDDLIDLFWDDDHGGFFFNGDDAESLIDREKEIQEGATPSGNSVAAVCLAKLASLTGEVQYSEKLESMYDVFYPIVKQHPYSTPFFLKAILMTEFPSKEVVLLGSGEEPSYRTFVKRAHETFTPNVVFLSSASGEQLAEAAPFAKEYRKVDEQATVYICENFSCQAPTTDLEQAANQLFGSS